MNRVDSGASPTPGDDPRLGGAAELTDDDAMLLRFVGDRDAPCPQCGYNLRGLMTPICPECRQQLRLQVGVVRPRLGGLVVTVAPGIFSGIAAGAMIVVFIVAMVVTRGAAGAPPPGFFALLAFGAASGLIALALLRWRFGFLQLRPIVQWTTAAVLWFVHLCAFAILLRAVI